VTRLTWREIRGAVVVVLPWLLALAAAVFAVIIWGRP
jgi:hypothetical protein